MFSERAIYSNVLVASIAFAGVFVFLRWLKGIGVKDAGKRYPPSLSVLQLFRSIRGGGLAALPEHFMRCAEKVGPIFSIRVPGRMVVVLSDYETILSAMVRQSEIFSDRGYFWTEEKVINQERRGISFARYDDAWKKRHKLVLSILKDFGFGLDRVMETRILQEVESMNEKLLRLNGCPIYPKWPFTFATSNVVISILFGKIFQQSLPNELSTIVENASECITNSDMTLNFAPFVRFLPTYRRKVNLLRTTSEKLLNSIEAGIKFNESNNTEATFVGRCKEIQGTDYDHQDLLYILRDLCFGSTKTVSTVLEWAMVELANHQAVLKRFHEEIDEIVPRDRLPSLDDKPRLPYADAVMLEVLRRHILAPFFVPHSAIEDTKLLGYDIPRGCVVLPNGYSVHMDPKIWKDPGNFRPERFLDQDNNIIKSEKMVAFGLGKRSCIGEILARQSTFLFLTSLVQRFDIRPPEGMDSIIVTEVCAISTVPSHFEVCLIPRMKNPDTRVETRDGC